MLVTASPAGTVHKANEFVEAIFAHTRFTFGDGCGFATLLFDLRFKGFLCMRLRPVERISVSLSRFYF